MKEELKKLLKKISTEEPFPEGSRSRREQQLIGIQVTIAVAFYTTVVYQILTSEKFWDAVDKYVESVGLAGPVIRMLIGIILLIPIPGAAIVYIYKKKGKR